MPNEYKSELSPSKDIVERLRKSGHWEWEIENICGEAADEIERLREGKEEILEMLKKAHIWHEKLSSLVSTCVVDIERLQQRDGFIAKLDKQIVERDDEIERLRKQLEMSEKRFAALKEAYDKNHRRNIQLYGSNKIDGAGIPWSPKKLTEPEALEEGL